MPTTVDFPTIVNQALELFGDIFDNEPARRHFAEYLTGLMVAKRKSISAINRQFATTADQSCLNRWLVEAAWDAAALNDRRLAWLQDNPKTRYSSHGVIAIDNTLVYHSGKLIEDVGWLWDHAHQRHVIPHDYLISNYVCPSDSHYPIEWRRFRKKDACAAEAFKDHTTLCLDLIDDALSRGIAGDFTFDSYFTHAKKLNHLHAKQRHYVAALKLNRKVVFDGREDKLKEVASQIPMTAKQAVRVGKRCYWHFSKRMRIATVNHPVRIVLFWKDRQATEANKALVSNPVVWKVLRMLKVYRHRWTGTEAFHRDAKQQLGLGEQLGLGDCQVRSGKGQTRHMYLVSAAHSLLMHAMPTSRPHEWIRRTLATIGEACRAVKDELLKRLVEWVVAKLNDDHWSMSQIKAVLTQT